MGGKNSKKTALVISYLATALSVVSNVLLVKLYLTRAGYNDYGLYQYVYSIAQYAIIMDFGISAVMVKHVLEYRVKGDEKGQENTYAYCLILFAIAVFVILAISIASYVNLGYFLEGRTTDDILLGKTMFRFMAISMILALIQHFLDGIMLTNERYTFMKVITMIFIGAKLLIICSFLLGGIGIMAAAYGEALAYLTGIIVSCCYIFKKIKVKIKLHYWDVLLFRSMLKLVFALALQSVVQYMSKYMGKIILGKLLTNSTVAIYSVAQTFTSFYDEVPTVIQRLYLPQATMLVAKGATGEELTDFVIKPGRYQFILCAGMVGGFFLFGREFIHMWAGAEADIAWLMTLLILVPDTVPLIQNVCLSILTAKNKRAYRSYVLLTVAALKCIATIYLVKSFGLIGATISGVIGILVGNILAMNIYYTKVIKLNISRMFKSIVARTWLCALGAIVICCPLELFLSTSGWLLWAVKCALFCIVYFICLWTYGFNAEEKKTVGAVARKLIRK